MRKIAIAVVLSAFSVAATPAVAAGFYAGVNLGQNTYDDSTMPNNTSTAFGFLV